MAALDFPDTPAVGDLFGSSGTVWRWDGARWASTAGASGARGAVGYAQIVSNIAGYATAVTDIYGLNVTFVADPARRYKTTLFFNCWSTIGGDSLIANITNGAGAGLAAATQYQGIGNQGRYLIVERVETGLSGSQTRKGMFSISGTGSGTVGASAGNPAFILVEDITYEAGSAGGGGGAVGTGLEAAKPTAPNAGTRYFATDTKRDWLYDGTGWIIMSEPAQTWNPPLGNVVVGASTSVGTSHRSDGWCDVQMVYTFGAGTSIAAGGVYVLLPYPQAVVSIGQLQVAFFDASNYYGGVVGNQANPYIYPWDATVPYLRIAGPLVNTIPFNWVAGCSVQFSGRYRMSSKYT